MGFMDLFRRRGRRYGNYYYLDEYYARRERDEKAVLQNNIKPQNSVVTPQKDITEKSIEPEEVVKSESIKSDTSINNVTTVPAKPNENKPNEMESKVKSPGLVNTVDTKKETGYIFSKPLYREKKNIITFVVENTEIVNSHKNEILRLVKKIVNDNSTDLFLFLRVGNDQKFFDVLDSEKVVENKIIEDLFTENGNNECKIDFSKALKHIDEFLKLLRAELGILECNEKKYDIQNLSMIFIGTAEYDINSDSKKEITNLLNSIRTNRKIKTIKYFCMEDKETINAAMLGFPVVGHIVSDFYK